MQSNGIAPNEIIYATAISGSQSREQVLFAINLSFNCGIFFFPACAKDAQWSVALGLLDQMEERKIPVSVVCFRFDFKLCKCDLLMKKIVAAIILLILPPVKIV